MNLEDKIGTRQVILLGGHRDGEVITCLNNIKTLLIPIIEERKLAVYKETIKDVFEFSMIEP